MRLPPPRIQRYRVFFASRFAVARSRARRLFGPPGAPRNSRFAASLAELGADACAGSRQGNGARFRDRIAAGRAGRAGHSGPGGNGYLACLPRAERYRLARTDGSDRKAACQACQKACRAQA
uniref:Uncharacterized protein n=1 Tax=mine drainage metagenome TaxID=410659 RepID=E6Q739_9ZZZZ